MEIEIDEMSLYVEKKKNQCGCSLPYSSLLKQIIAFSLGRRCDKSCQNLLRKLSDTAQN
jgi:IS1 family transposase